MTGISTLNNLRKSPEIICGLTMKDFVDRQYGLTPENRIFPITDRAIQKKMKQKTEQAKLKPIRVHDLRHSHIALLIEKGMQPLVIA